MNKISGVTLERSKIGNCRRCDKVPEGEEFKGTFNEHCTHMTSDGGWWLRIEHKIDFFEEGHPRLADKVGELLCPDCLKIHNEAVSELFSEALLKG